MSKYPKAPHKEQHMTTRFGVKVTTKPRCWKCGQMMRVTYIRIKANIKAPNRTFVKLDTLWYCPDCDMAVKQL